MPLPNSKQSHSKWQFHGLRSHNGKAIGISAASIVPFVRKGGRHFALFQIEDMQLDGTWTPALSMLGGKVEPTDCHWVETITRELKEEVGEAREAIRPLIDRLRSTLHDPTLLQTEHRASSTYVVSSKHEVMFLPVDLSEVKDLPGAYYREYNGLTSSDLKPGDWTRAAHCIVWVEISPAPGNQGIRILPTPLDPECEEWLQGHGIETRNKDKFPNPGTLPFKHWLQQSLNQIVLV